MRYFKFFQTLIFPVLIFIFSISVQSQTTVLSEDFEGGTYVVTPGGVPAWAINNTLQVSGTNSYNNVVALNDSSWVTTDVMDFTGYNFVLLEFQHICKIEFFDAAEILISIDNGTTWTKLTSAEYINNNNSQFTTSGDKFTATAYPVLWEASVPAAVPTNSWWMKEQFDISSIAANETQVRIKFRLKDGNGNGANLHAGWFLDDIKVIGSPFELIPPTITLNTPIPQDTIFGTGPFPVSAEITDASGISVAYLIYTVNSITDSIIMVNTLGDTYEGTIPSMPLNSHVDWYVSAFDNPPANNETSSLAYWFFTKKAPFEYIIGDGTLVPTYTLYSPLYRFSGTSTNRYTASNVLYTQTELAAAGIFPGTAITSISYEKASSGGTDPSSAMELSVYMANSINTPPLSTSTTVGDIQASHTLVYNNIDHQIAPLSGWTEIVLDNPFTYTGGSIEIAVFSGISGTSPYSTDKFDWIYTDGYADYVIGQFATSPLVSTTALSATTASYKHRANIKIKAQSNVYNLDAGIIGVTAPSGTQITGVPVPVEVTLRNFGTDTLLSVDIAYSVNGTPQGTFNWTGWLTEDMVEANINIGNATFVDGNNELKVWTANPNSGVDLNTNNDTSVVNLWACQSILSGTYTIDSTMVTGGTNFQSFDDAMTALTFCGVNGPIVFEIAPRVYNTRLVFSGTFPGVSATNTVTFKGTTGAEIFYTTTVSADRAAILLDGAKYLRFDSLTVTIPESSGFGNGFQLINQAEDIQITNCIVNVHGATTSLNYNGIVASGSLTSATTTGNSAHNVLVENNTINGGYYGIMFYGAAATPLNGIEIKNNTVNNSYYYNIRTGYTNSVEITGNYAEGRSTGGTTFQSGIYLTFEYQTFNISKNKIVSPGQYGIYVASATAPSGESIIANNMIGGGFRNATPSGIYLVSGANIGIYYNSVYMNIAGAGRSMYVASAVTNLNVLNNSFAYFGGTTGYATYGLSSASFAQHNNNNYYSNGSNFVYYGAARADLTALQAVNVPVGNDMASRSGNPVYFSEFNLYTTATQLYQGGVPIPSITDDIDGNPRDLVAPCIGASEFVPPADDAGIIAITYPPASACGLTNTEQIKVAVKNWGGAVINSLDVTYVLDGGTPVTETFAVNILPDEQDTLTFTSTIDLSSFGIHEIDAWVTLAGDNTQVNDSLFGYLVRHDHDFYSSAYIQGFEPVHFPQDWTVFNGDGSAFKWDVPFSGIPNTGSNSARFSNGAANTGEDWMFSRCFTMQAGETYDLSFFYRGSSTTVNAAFEVRYGNDNAPAAMTTTILDIPVVVNTTYQFVNTRFTIPADGTYYFGWKNNTAPSTILTYIDDINIKLIPTQEAAIIAATQPVEGCDLGLEPVTIQVMNLGADSIHSIDVFYQITGEPAFVTETVNSSFGPNDTLTYTFTTLADLTTPTDSTFEFTAWIALAGDPMQNNDTIIFEVNSFVTPAPPVTENDTVNYGNIASLVAISSATNYWFTDSLAANHFFIGDTLITVPLFADITYWVHASNSAPPVNAQVGTGTATSTSTPVNGFWDYGWSASIYKTDDMNFSGKIDTIFYQISSTTNNHLMLDQRIYMKHVPFDVHSSTNMPSNATFTQVFSGDITWVGPGWFAIPLSQPFNYNGIDNLMILWENWDGDYVTGYPTFYQTASTAQTSLYKVQDNTFPTTAGTYTANRPNIIFAVSPTACPSERVPVTAVVNLPLAEPEIISIVDPLAEDCSNNANIVSIEITNNGTDTIQSGLTATYQINSDAPVTENVTNSVAPGDTVLFAFATPFALNLTTGDSTILITSWVNHPSDPYNLNDTTSRNATLGFSAPSPLADNDTIPYATQATLVATSPYMLRWYDSPVSSTVLDTGSVFVTPVLYANTQYWVGASEGLGIADSLETSFAGGNGCGGGAMFNVTATSADLIINGFTLTTNISNANMPINVYYKTGPYQGSETIAANWTLVGNYFANAVTDVPFFLACDDIPVSSGQEYGIYIEYSARYTTITAPQFYSNADLEVEVGAGLCGSFASVNANRAFNGRIHYVSAGAGCESPRTEVWAIIDTLTMPTADAGVVSIDEPFDPANLQPNDVKVTIQNFGSDTLTTVDIVWTLNGAPQTTFNWFGSLAQGQTESDILISSSTFALGMNEIIAWTENPNGANDVFNMNDTAYYSFEAFEPLCGIYHIGGTNPDFATFTEAAAGLANWGISCPVTFIVEDGVYNEQVVFGEVDGADATNTITFIGNGNATTLSFAPSVSAVRYVLKLDSAKYYRFEDLTIEAEAAATYGWTVHLMNGCEDIQFTNCHIKTNTTSSSTFFAAFIANGSATSATTGGNAVSNIVLDGNTFTGGYYGVLFAGLAASRMDDVEIINNTLINQYYYGIYVSQLNMAIVNHNTVQGRTQPTTTTSSYGIYHTNIAPPFEINKNKVFNVGQYGIYVTASSVLPATTRSVISNNMIGGGFTSTSTLSSGLYLTSVEKVDVWYNSINMDGSVGRGTYINTTATQIDFRNNSLAYTGTSTGYAHYSVGTTSYLAHDYNNYYSTGSNFVYYGLARANLAALQAVNLPANNDANSQVGNPFYYSNTDLHASTTQLWGSGTPIASIIDDIDGDLRDPVAPAIGADEYTPAAVDAAVVAGLEPSAGCGLTSTEIISVRLKNMGIDTLFTMDISYSVNGLTPVTETWNDTLVVGDYLDYTFTQTADLSSPGVYNIFFDVDAAGDALPFNDTLTYSIKSGHDFYSSNYFMGFELGEDYSQWTVVDVNSDGRTWEPGHNSTTYAHTGSRSARFYNGTTNPGNDYLFSDCFYLEAGTAYKIEFWFRAENASYAQSLDLVVANDVTPLGVIDTLLQFPLYTHTVHQLASAIYSPPSDGVYYFGWYAYSPAANFWSYVDDINIRILAPLDAGVVSIDNVDDMEDGGSSINMQVTIKNYGSQTLTTMPVSYSINGGAWVTNTWTGSIDADEEDMFTFTTPFIVPDGDYTICVRTELPGDGNPGNDELCDNRYGLPILALPHFDDFEGTQLWYIEGTTNQWQFGTPSASTINSAYSPTHAWATVLAGNYANNSSYYLYTPKFDFTNVNNMMLGFWHWIDTENNVDGGKIQYSTNNGATWTTLGVLNDPSGTNWYNAANINNAPGFSGSSAGWQYSEISVAALDNFPLPVQFRFHFFSNASVNYNGWAIDNFEIYQPAIPYDAGVIDIEAPVAQSITGGQNQVTIRLKNFGTETLTSIPVRYRVMTGPPPVSGTWTGTLAPGAETTFTFPTTYTGPINATYNLCSWTELAGDSYKFNDTTCVSLNAGPANIDAGVIDILSPTTTTSAGSTVTVTVRVKNHGLQTLNIVPIQFLIDGVPMTTEAITTPLAPGAETDYTFITTYTAPASEYQLCAKTTVSGDAINTNDEFCRELLVGIEDMEREGVVLMQNIPNPATDETVIGFSIPTGGQIVFSVTNVLGEMIYTETSDYAPGLHSILVNTRSMAAGLYYYSITFNQIKLTRKMIVQ